MNPHDFVIERSIQQTSRSYNTCIEITKDLFRSKRPNGWTAIRHAYKPFVNCDNEIEKRMCGIAAKLVRLEQMRNNALMMKCYGGMYYGKYLDKYMPQTLLKHKLETGECKIEYGKLFVLKNGEYL